jgi:multidrug efflux system membrane fusion protein
MKKTSRWPVASGRGMTSQETRWPHSRRRTLSTAHGLFGAALAGAIIACSGVKPKPAEEKVPVTVAVAEEKNVPMQIRVIGSVEPLSNVAVRALAGGQLTRVSFREGDDVHQGQLLFTIDPRPYQATLSQAEANLARDEAAQRNADAEATRYAGLVKNDYVTKEDYDRITTAAQAAKAVVAADRATIESAKLQLSYCEIRSPMDGRTGSLMVHAGNVVKANDTTPLVTINQIAPINVQFSVPEAQFAEIRAKGDLRSVPVSVAPQGTGPAISNGRLTFMDNAVDAATGTISLKATFPNQTAPFGPGSTSMSP